MQPKAHATTSTIENAGDDSSEADAMTVWVDDWDTEAPWLPWASYSDPIGARTCTLFASTLSC